MIRPLKIAHTSDIHLREGADGDKACRAFSRVIDMVHEAGADILLIAGDFFDDNQVAPSLIDFACHELARLRCPTVMIAGNHDCWSDDAALRRMPLRDAAPRVSLLASFEGARVEFPELHATVWGRCLVDHHPDFRPLGGAPPRLGNFWHIGMAHGLYTDDLNAGRGSPITPAEIESSGFDYLALGHVHVHRQFRHGRTLACYPGSPVNALNSQADGCVTLVDLAPDGDSLAIAHPLRAKN